jgi:hypothetical protein
MTQIVLSPLPLKNPPKSIKLRLRRQPKILQNKSQRKRKILQLLQKNQQNKLKLRMVLLRKLFLRPKSQSNKHLHQKRKALKKNQRRLLKLNHRFKRLLPLLRSK